MSWTPSMRDWIANLDDAAGESPDETFTAHPRDGITLVRDFDGGLQLHLECPPQDVTTDTSGRSLRVVRDADGAVVRVAATVPRELAAPVLDDVLTLVDGGTPPGVAGHESLVRWRDVLAAAPGRPMDQRRQAGLHGELSVLLEILDAGGTLDMWTGWSGAPKDFALPGLAIEVKTTTSPDYRRVQVHGLRQLETPLDGSDVVLSLRRVELSPHGTSLPSLVDDLLERSISRSTLLERLLDAGYSEAHRSIYRDTRFTTESVALRWIDDGHPRLVPSMLRDVDLQAIGSVRYELDLNGTESEDIEQTVAELIAESLGTDEP